MSPKPSTPRSEGFGQWSTQDDENWREGKAEVRFSSHVGRNRRAEDGKVIIGSGCGVEAFKPARVRIFLLPMVWIRPGRRGLKIRRALSSLPYVRSKTSSIRRERSRR